MRRTVRGTEGILLMTTAPALRSATRSSVPAKVGVVLAAFQGLANLVLVLSDFGTQMPTLAINVLTVVVGVAVLVSVVPGWRGARWGLVLLAAGTVLLSLPGLFAFFVPGVPAGATIAAAVGIVLAVLTAALLLIPRRS